MHALVLSNLFIILPLLVAAIPAKPNPNVISLTKRTKVTGEDGVVNAEILRRHLSTVASKLERGMRAFEKNTGSPHPNDSKLLPRTRRATGAVRLTDSPTSGLWQGSVSVGTPASTFIVDFDTGSSDFFLPGTTCRLNCQGHKEYDPIFSSSTAIDQGTKYSLAFADGSTVAGEVFTDSVAVGGLQVTDQAVGFSTQYSTGFSISEFTPDGLMGMAFVEISVFGSNPFFQTAIEQNVPTAGQFGVKLATVGSELFLGGVDSKLFTGSFTQLPLTQPGFWQIDLGSVDVNGVAAAGNLSAIVDTGTSVVLGDMASVTAFYAKVPGATSASNILGPGFFTFPCNTLPPVSLSFSGRSFPISATTFSIGQISAGSTQCVGGIVGMDGLNFWVLGDVFLQNVYTSFDVTNRRVGFATLLA